LSLELINSPIFVTLQDKGRYGYSNIGVTNSGVMDEYAYFWANKMLGNSLETNILEIAFSNVIFKVNASTQISITGARCEFFINDIQKECWQTYKVKAGDIIKIAKILEGNRVYLGVFGGFNITKEFGSNSTTIKENLGGLDGEKLKKGDILAFDEYLFFYNKRLKKEFIPSYNDELTLRVILGYQDENFSQIQKNKFFSNIFTLSNDFNRMGCKLNGEPILCDIDGIISEGISFGAIQIPSDGQPIILLKDRQTIGGYPKIGSVLSIDCFKLSQAKANTKIRFQEITYIEASKKVKEFYSFFF
jgi:biotin-dependent carboxylase-like uncharacterized protein